MILKKHVPDKANSSQIVIPDRLKELDKTQYFAVLATNDEGQPYTSLISFAVTPDLKSIIFATPKKTSKYKNLLKTKKVAVLIDNRPNTPKNIMEAEAVTIIGTARLIRRGKIRDELATILLKKHPDLEEFIQADNTSLIKVEAKRCIHVSKFQAINASDWE